MRKAMTLLMLLGMVGTSGCWRAAVVAKDVERGQTHEATGRIFLYGLVSTSSAHVKAGEVCPNGLARVQSEHTVVDRVLLLVTLGIYTPVTIRYTCVR